MKNKEILFQELLEQDYLTKEHLSGFDNYKYNARDTSPLSVYVMHPFWNYIVRFCPKWVAPNTLTFAGFLFSAANFVLLSWYDWNYFASSGKEGSVPIPNWVWLACAINIFLAYTLDGIDGKQARRIGLSGPLGELFDHGLDSYTAVLIPSCLYSIFGRCETSIPPIRMYYICWTVFFNFYVSHWEKYNTGVLYLPWGYDLSMWGSTLLYLITWHYGYEIWKNDLPFNIPLGRTMELTLHISAMSNIPMVIYNVHNSYKNKTGKMRPFSEAARPMYPFLTFMFLLLFWAFKSPSNIIEKDPRALFLLSGTIFSNISCRLIVSQMSSTRCEGFHWMTPIFIISMIIAFYIPFFERLILYLLCLGTTLAHWQYGAKVVQQMCKHFNRICFKVTPVIMDSQKPN
ncbi:ethanolaminephosphotransferase 1 [Condylostylus longicornis]|uniref:ethanolaminephosphotransferase 1 n=1 Tax=Condylostylus longicornis TaxID=2530218 RepID=UPI00244E21B9|nr:ethanolaminephosphotransferase 1 [Condylostylus longicornis]